MSKFRIDIQALRGVAVLLVMLDHFDVPGFSHGYLGVDIFFVISGFLITSLIAGEMANGTFSFSRFYFRRAKRLLPAALVTILLTCIGGFFFLSSLESEALLTQVVGALTFSINYVLWNQTGYFDVAAATKPLLHMWSLAVEEQFYIFYPLILSCTPSRHWLKMIVALFTASLVACVVLLIVAPSVAFYFLPTRAWELLIGAAGALIWHRPYVREVLGRSARFSWQMIIVMLVLPIALPDLPHPGVSAFLVCIATLIQLLRNPEIVTADPFVRGFAKIGDWSYSLYLVHWPIVVFMPFAFLSVTPSIRTACFALSFALGFVMNRYIEEPIRRMPQMHPRFVTVAVLSATVIIAVQAMSYLYSISNFDFGHERRPNYGFDAVCDNWDFANRAECKNTANPKTLIWGDSHAMHIIPGALEHESGGIQQATFSSCPPYTAYAPYLPVSSDPEKLARRCIKFNEDVFSYLKSADWIRQVVLAGNFTQYLDQASRVLKLTAAGDSETKNTGAEQLLSDFGATVAALKALGKDVIVISPPPQVGEFMLKCAERSLSSVSSQSDAIGDCELKYEEFRGRTKIIASFIEQLRLTYGVRVIDLSDGTCDGKVCYTIREGTLLYRDGGHLSYEGSKYVFDRLAGGPGAKIF